MSVSGTYAPEEHRFRFAAWTAGRAAQRGAKGLKMPVVFELLQKADCRMLANDPASLPTTVETFDQNHRHWCDQIRQGNDVPVSVTYGRAAKLVNVFLKCIYLSEFGSPSAHPGVRWVHPPIDNLLLKNLGRHLKQNGKPHQEVTHARWTKFSPDEYTRVIELITDFTGGERWKAEQFWEGYN